MSELKTKRSVGRPLTGTGVVTKSVVRSYVDKHGNDGFTIEDIVSESQLGRDDVKNHVNLLVRRGELIRIPNAKKRQGAGRPMTVFKLAE